MSKVNKNQRIRTKICMCHDPYNSYYRNECRNKEFNCNTSKYYNIHIYIYIENRIFKINLQKSTDKKWQA